MHREQSEFPVDRIDRLLIMTRFYACDKNGVLRPHLRHMHSLHVYIIHCVYCKISVLSGVQKSVNFNIDYICRQSLGNLISHACMI